MVETNSRCSMIHRNLSQDIKKQQLCLKELKKLIILHAEHLKDDYLRYQREFCRMGGILFNIFIANDMFMDKHDVLDGPILMYW